MYYQTMADDSEPSKVLDPIHALLIRNEDKILQEQLEIATRNICNPKTIIPVGHHSMTAVMASTNSTIKYLTSSWSDLSEPTAAALDRISKSFEKLRCFRLSWRSQGVCWFRRFIKVGG